MSALRRDVMDLYPTQYDTVKLASSKLSGNPRAHELILMCFAELAMIYDVKFYLVRTSNRVVEYPENLPDDTYLVHFWAVPLVRWSDVDLIQKQPDQVWGYSLSTGQRDFLQPVKSPKVTNVVDDNKTCVLQIVGRNLFIPYDLSFSDTNLKEILMRTFTEYFSGKLKLTARILDEKDLLVYHLVQRWIHLSNEDFNRLIEEKKSEIHRMDDLLKSYWNRIAELEAEKLQATIALKAAEMSVATLDTKKIQHDVEKLIAEYGDQVNMDGETLIINLKDPVCVFYQDKVYTLGRYKISIDVNAQVEISAFDQSFPYPHPHVAQNGQPDFGEMSVQVGKLIGDYQLFSLVQLIKSFLHTVRPESWYYPVTEWPIIGG